jgi:hypothetical protein
LRFCDLFLYTMTNSFNLLLSAIQKPESYEDYQIG